MNGHLIHFNRARQELILAKSIDEVKSIRDKAEALRAYAKQAGYGLEMQNDCAEIKLRAERRAGEMLREMDIKAGNPQLLHDVTIAPKLEDLGITRIQSHRWQVEESVPEDRFEQHVAEVKAKGEELTSVGLIRLALRQSQPSSAINIPLPTGKYRTIVIDPPWPMVKILRETRPNQLDMDYPTYTIDDIKALPIEDLAMDDGCHIYLWTTHKFLPTAFYIFVEVWGVNYECLLTWVKNVGFVPYSWMYSTEHCLFGRVGSLPLLKVGERLDFSAPVREHSRKPDGFYNRVRNVSPEPRIDMFSREKREGFDQYGNETRKFNT